MVLGVTNIKIIFNYLSSKATPAVLAVAPRLKPQDDQQRKTKRKSGESEKQNTERSFQTHIRQSEREREREENWNAMRERMEIN